MHETKYLVSHILMILKILSGRMQ